MPPSYLFSVMTKVLVLVEPSLNVHDHPTGEGKSGPPKIDRRTHLKTSNFKLKDQFGEFGMSRGIDRTPLIETTGFGTGNHHLLNLTRQRFVAAELAGFFQGGWESQVEFFKQISS